MSRFSLVFIALVMIISSAFSFRTLNSRWTKFPLYSTEMEVTTTETDSSAMILLTEKAQNHLKKLKQDRDVMYLRMGVKSGGCSGMSYIMDIIDPSAVTQEDLVETYDNINCVVDPKSLLYIYGMELDYSDELIGGGFKFQNPNAETACGCGKSFGV